MSSHLSRAVNARPDPYEGAEHGETPHSWSSPRVCVRQHLPSPLRDLRAVKVWRDFTLPRAHCSSLLLRRATMRLHGLVGALVVVLACLAGTGHAGDTKTVNVN